MDTTNNHPRKGKEYTYKVDRLKLKNPIVLQKELTKNIKLDIQLKLKKQKIRKIQQEVVVKPVVL